MTAIKPKEHRYTSLAEYNGLLKEIKQIQVQFKISTNVYRKTALVKRFHEKNLLLEEMRKNLPPGTTFKKK